jgi:hypothetical protein
MIKKLKHIGYQITCPSGNATTQALNTARTNDHGPEEAEIPTGEENYSVEAAVL